MLLLHDNAKAMVDAICLLCDHKPFSVLFYDFDWHRIVLETLKKIPLHVNNVWLKSPFFRHKMTTLLDEIQGKSYSACLKWEFLIISMQDIIRECGTHYGRVVILARKKAELPVHYQRKLIGVPLYLLMYNRDGIHHMYVYKHWKSQLYSLLRPKPGVLSC
ncbi:hypothetical protein KP509_34G041600 [Ceratopteris richardii]|uniref:Uncharacterized protein n=1 Tax=Ceratopteris richardii TaxID=49495 RepID=A0A8T2QKQ3_CERRI|nr:hypothetical protein KP509_34G041600 [Ceratopteris richardii]